MTGTIRQIEKAGFTLELLPNDKLSVKPDTLTQQQHEYLGINEAEIIRDLQLNMIEAWLHKIWEPPEDHHLLLNKCRSNSDASAYFMQHVKGEFRYE